MRPCSSLADMTSLGMTVIAVIHQPRYSSFNLFDQVRPGRAVQEQ